ncbi:MAG: hypothetical protein ABH885_01140 [Candidatus Omnitrophota bacterium]
MLVKRGEAWDRYLVNTLAASAIKDDEKFVHMKFRTHAGKLFDDEYKDENYDHVEESERDAFDYQEETSYRDYAAKVGMGGRRLAELYKKIEELYAYELMQNVESYLAGIISEREYERNINEIRRYREAHRNAIELYLLGSTTKMDISDLVANKKVADRLYGILKDLTLYMSEEEKREFIKGGLLTKLTQQYDSVFDLMVERYDGALFYKQYLQKEYESDNNLRLKTIYTSHMEAIDTYFSKFRAAETPIWSAYEGKTTTQLQDYSKTLTAFVNALASSQMKRTGFFDSPETGTWVPYSYDEFKKAASPGIMKTNTAAEKLGAAVFKKIQEFMKAMGLGMHQHWLTYNRYWMMGIMAEIVRQARVDEYFYEYSNTMERIIQHLTAFTDTAGLNYETKRGEFYMSWWATDGWKYHMDNYAYSDDERLRNAYMGKQILEELTRDAFNAVDTELELEAQRIIATITGQSVGSYQYKQYGDENTLINTQTGLTYSRSVVGDSRYSQYKVTGTGTGETTYAELKGTYDKKVKGELADKWFLHGQTDKDAGSSTATASGSDSAGALAKYDVERGSLIEGATEKPSVSGGGATFNAYNDAIDQAIKSFSSAVTGKISQIEKMELLQYDYAGNVEPIDGYYDGGVILSAAHGVIPADSTYTLSDGNLAYDKICLTTLFKEDVKTFSNTMYGIEKTLTNNIVKLMSYNAAGDTGARKALIRSSLSGEDVNIDNLWNDSLNLLTTQTEFYEETIKRARDYIENGLPGSSWTDALSGAADGRNNLHIYAKHQFAEYFKPDVNKFTNDQTYDVLERTGKSYFKLLGLYHSDGDTVTTRNRAFLSMQHYKKGFDYEVSNLTEGVTEQYERDRQGKITNIRKFGQGSITYGLDVIADLSSGAFVYFNDEKKLYTDKRGARGPRKEDGTYEYIDVDLSVQNMRETMLSEMERMQKLGMPLQIISQDDYNVQRVTTFSNFYDTKAKMWKRLVYSADDKEGYYLNRVYDIGGLRLSNIEYVFDAVYKTELKVRLISGYKWKLKDVQNPLLRALTGTIKGIAVVFGLLGKEKDWKKDSQGRFLFDATMEYSKTEEGEKEGLFSLASIASRLEGLTRYNVVSRLRRVMSLTGQTQVLGMIGGVKVVLSSIQTYATLADGTKVVVMGFLHAIAPEIMPAALAIKAMGAIHSLTGAYTANVRTLDGFKVIVSHYNILLRSGMAKLSLPFGMQYRSVWMQGPRVEGSTKEAIDASLLRASKTPHIIDAILAMPKVEISTDDLKSQEDLAAIEATAMERFGTLFDELKTLIVPFMSTGGITLYIRIFDFARINGISVNGMFGTQTRTIDGKAVTQNLMVIDLKGKELMDAFSGTNEDAAIALLHKFYKTYGFSVLITMEGNAYASSLLGENGEFLLATVGDRIFTPGGVDYSFRRLGEATMSADGTTGAAKVIVAGLTKWLTKEQIEDLKDRYRRTGLFTSQQLASIDFYADETNTGQVEFFNVDPKKSITLTLSQETGSGARSLIIGRTNVRTATLEFAGAFTDGYEITGVERSGDNVMLTYAGNVGQDSNLTLSAVFDKEGKQISLNISSFILGRNDEQRFNQSPEQKAAIAQLERNADGLLTGSEERSGNKDTGYRFLRGEGVVPLFDAEGDMVALRAWTSETSGKYLVQFGGLHIADIDIQVSTVDFTLTDGAITVNMDMKGTEVLSTHGDAIFRASVKEGTLSANSLGDLMFTGVVSGDQLVRSAGQGGGVGGGYSQATTKTSHEIWRIDGESNLFKSHGDVQYVNNACLAFAEGAEITVNAGCTLGGMTFDSQGNIEMMANGMFKAKNEFTAHIKRTDASQESVEYWGGHYKWEAKYDSNGVVQLRSVRQNWGGYEIMTAEGTLTRVMLMDNSNPGTQLQINSDWFAMNTTGVIQDFVSDLKGGADSRLVGVIDGKEFEVLIPAENISFDLSASGQLLVNVSKFTVTVDENKGLGLVTSLTMIDPPKDGSSGGEEGAAPQKTGVTNMYVVRQGRDGNGRPVVLMGGEMEIKNSVLSTRMEGANIVNRSGGSLTIEHVLPSTAVETHYLGSGDTLSIVTKGSYKIGNELVLSAVAKEANRGTAAWLGAIAGAVIGVLLAPFTAGQSLWLTAAVIGAFFIGGAIGGLVGYYSGAGDLISSMQETFGLEGMLMWTAGNPITDFLAGKAEGSFGWAVLFEAVNILSAFMVHLSGGFAGSGGAFGIHSASKLKPYEKGIMFAFMVAELILTAGIGGATKTAGKLLLNVMLRLAVATIATVAYAVIAGKSFDINTAMLVFAGAWVSVGILSAVGKAFGNIRNFVKQGGVRGALAGFKDGFKGIQNVKSAVLPGYKAMFNLSSGMRLFASHTLSRVATFFKNITSVGTFVNNIKQGWRAASALKSGARILKATGRVHSFGAKLGMVAQGFFTGKFHVVRSLLALTGRGLVSSLKGAGLVLAGAGGMIWSAVVTVLTTIGSAAKTIWKEGLKQALSKFASAVWTPISAGWKGGQFVTGGVFARLGFVIGTAARHATKFENLLKARRAAVSWMIGYTLWTSVLDLATGRDGKPGNQSLFNLKTMYETGLSMFLFSLLSPGVSAGFAKVFDAATKGVAAQGLGAGRLLNYVANKLGNMKVFQAQGGAGMWLRQFTLESLTNSYLTIGFFLPLQLKAIGGFTMSLTIVLLETFGVGAGAARDIQQWQQKLKGGANLPLWQDMALMMYGFGSRGVFESVGDGLFTTQSLKFVGIFQILGPFVGAFVGAFGRGASESFNSSALYVIGGPEMVANVSLIRGFIRLGNAIRRGISFMTGGVESSVLSRSIGAAWEEGIKEPFLAATIFRNAPESMMEYLVEVIDGSGGNAGNFKAFSTTDAIQGFASQMNAVSGFSNAAGAVQVGDYLRQQGVAGANLLEVVAERAAQGNYEGAAQAMQQFLTQSGGTVSNLKPTGNANLDACIGSLMRMNSSMKMGERLAKLNNIGDLKGLGIAGGFAVVGVEGMRALGQLMASNPFVQVNIKNFEASRAVVAGALIMRGTEKADLALAMMGVSNKFIDSMRSMRTSASDGIRNDLRSMAMNLAIGNFNVTNENFNGIIGNSLFALAVKHNDTAAAYGLGASLDVMAAIGAMGQDVRQAVAADMQSRVGTMKFDNISEQVSLLIIGNVMQKTPGNLQNVVRTLTNSGSRTENFMNALARVQVFDAATQTFNGAALQAMGELMRSEAGAFNLENLAQHVPRLALSIYLGGVVTGADISALAAQGNLPSVATIQGRLEQQGAEVAGQAPTPGVAQSTAWMAGNLEAIFDAGTAAQLAGSNDYGMIAQALHNAVASNQTLFSHAQAQQTNTALAALGVNTLYSGQLAPALLESMGVNSAVVQALRQDNTLAQRVGNALGHDFIAPSLEIEDSHIAQAVDRMAIAHAPTAGMQKALINAVLPAERAEVLCNMIDTLRSTPEGQADYAKAMESFANSFYAFSQIGDHHFASQMESALMATGNNALLQFFDARATSMMSDAHVVSVANALERAGQHAAAAQILKAHGILTTMDTDTQSMGQAVFDHGTALEANLGAVIGDTRAGQLIDAFNSQDTDQGREAVAQNIAREIQSAMTNNARTLFAGSRAERTLEALGNLGVAQSYKVDQATQGKAQTFLQMKASVMNERVAGALGSMLRTPNLSNEIARFVNGKQNNLEALNLAAQGKLDNIERVQQIERNQRIQTLVNPTAEEAAQAALDRVAQNALGQLDSVKQDVQQVRSGIAAGNFGSARAALDRVRTTLGDELSNNPILNRAVSMLEGAIVEGAPQVQVAQDIVDSMVDNIVNNADVSGDTAAQFNTDVASLRQAVQSGNLGAARQALNSMRAQLGDQVKNNPTIQQAVGAIDRAVTQQAQASAQTSTTQAAVHSVTEQVVRAASPNLNQSAIAQLEQDVATLRNELQNGNLTGAQNALESMRDTLGEQVHGNPLLNAAMNMLEGAISNEAPMAQAALQMVDRLIQGVTDSAQVSGDTASRLQADVQSLRSEILQGNFQNAMGIMESIRDNIQDQISQNPALNMAMNVLQDTAMVEAAENHTTQAALQNIVSSVVQTANTNAQGRTALDAAARQFKSEMAQGNLGKAKEALQSMRDTLGNQVQSNLFLNTAMNALERSVAPKASMEAVSETALNEVLDTVVEQANLSQTKQAGLESDAAALKDALQNNDFDVAQSMLQKMTSTLGRQTGRNPYMNMAMNVLNGIVADKAPMSQAAQGMMNAMADSVANEAILDADEKSSLTETMSTFQEELRQGNLARAAQVLSRMRDTIGEQVTTNPFLNNAMNMMESALNARRQPAETAGDALRSMSDSMVANATATPATQARLDQFNSQLKTALANGNLGQAKDVLSGMKEALGEEINNNPFVGAAMNVLEQAVNGQAAMSEVTADVAGNMADAVVENAEVSAEGKIRLGEHAENLRSEIQQGNFGAAQATLAQMKAILGKQVSVNPVINMAMNILEGAITKDAPMAYAAQEIVNNMTDGIVANAEVSQAQRSELEGTAKSLREEFASGNVGTAREALQKMKDTIEGQADALEGVEPGREGAAMAMAMAMGTLEAVLNQAHAMSQVSRGAVSSLTDDIMRQADITDVKRSQLQKQIAAFRNEMAQGNIGNAKEALEAVKKTLGTQAEGNKVIDNAMKALERAVSKEVVMGKDANRALNNADQVIDGMIQEVQSREMNAALDVLAEQAGVVLDAQTRAELIGVVSNANEGMMREGQTVTVRFGNQVYTVTAETDGVSLLDALKAQMTKTEAGKKDYKALVASLTQQFGRAVLPFEVTYAVMKNGDVHFSSKAEIGFDATGRILYMNSTETVSSADRDNIAFRGHTHPHVALDASEFMADTVAMMARERIYGQAMPEFILERGADGKISVRILQHEGNQFMLAKVVDGKVVSEGVLRTTEDALAKDSLAVAAGIGALDSWEKAELLRLADTQGGALGGVLRDIVAIARPQLVMPGLTAPTSLAGARSMFSEAMEAGGRGVSPLESGLGVAEAGGVATAARTTVERHDGSVVTGQQLAGDIFDQFMISEEGRVMVVAIDGYTRAKPGAQQAIRVLEMMGAEICYVENGESASSVLSKLNYASKNNLATADVFALIDERNSDMLDGLSLIDNVKIRMMRKTTSWSEALTNYVDYARVAGKTIITEVATQKLASMAEQGGLRVQNVKSQSVDRDTDAEFLSELEAELAY